MADQERDESGVVPETHDVMRLVDVIRPMLRGVAPEVVGAVLADLTAKFIVSHVAENEDLTKKSREQVLKIQIQTIKRLMPLNEEMIKAKVEAARDDLKAQGKASQH
jgi:hypothetical protein